MNKKLLPLVMLLVFGTCMPLSHDSRAFAAIALAAVNEKAGFRLQWSEVDGRIRVAVLADKLDDLYAFEIKVRFDAAKLRYMETAMPSKGFSLKPKVDSSVVRLVHTKTGSIAGESGSLELAVLSFARINGGEAAISIEHAALVDSQLNRLDKNPSSKMVIPASAGSFSFSDTAGHWAEAVIREASGQGWATGYEDGSFRPDRPVTRAELAVLLVRAFELPGAGREPAFADGATMAAWARPHVAAVQAAGFMSGYEDGSFRPDRHVTRAELAVVLARALGLPLDTTIQLSRFADAERIPSWARPSAVALVEAGIVRGKSGNRFAPLDNATRAEVCSLLLQALVYH